MVRNYEEFQYLRNQLQSHENIDFPSLPLKENITKIDIDEYLNIILNHVNNSFLLSSAVIKFLDNEVTSILQQLQLAQISNQVRIFSSQYLSLHYLIILFRFCN